MLILTVFTLHASMVRCIEGRRRKMTWRMEECNEPAKSWPQKQAKEVCFITQFLPHVRWFDLGFAFACAFTCRLRGCLLDSDCCLCMWICREAGGREGSAGQQVAAPMLGLQASICNLMRPDVYLAPWLWHDGTEWLSLRGITRVGTTLQGSKQEGGVSYLDLITLYCGVEMRDLQVVGMQIGL
jgi:hypothetical protein